MIKKKLKENSYHQDYQNLDFLILLLVDLRDGDWLRERRERFGEPLRDLDLHVNELETSVDDNTTYSRLIPSWWFTQRASRTRRSWSAAFWSRWPKASPSWIVHGKHFTLDNNRALRSIKIRHSLSLRFLWNIMYNIFHNNPSTEMIPCSSSETVYQQVGFL